MILHVEHLNEEITKTDLEEIFGRYGSVSIRLSKNEAAIEFTKLEQAERAFYELDGIEMKGQTIFMQRLYYNRRKNRGKKISRHNKLNGFKICENLKKCRMKDKTIDCYVDLTEDYK
jgi:RNA recognition motif-containing protein